MPYKDYNNNFKVDLSEDKPVLQLDLQLKPMSEAPKDGRAVLCLVATTTPKHSMQITAV